MNSVDNDDILRQTRSLILWAKAKIVYDVNSHSPLAIIAAFFMRLMAVFSVIFSTINVFSSLFGLRNIASILR